MEESYRTNQPEKADSRYLQKPSRTAVIKCDIIIDELKEFKSLFLNLLNEDPGDNIPPGNQSKV